MGSPVPSLGLAGFVAGIVLILAVAPAAPQEAGLELRPRWKAGDERTLELVRRRQLTRTQGSQQVAFRADVTVRVLAAGADGSVVQWAFGDVRFEEPADRRDPVLSELLASAHGLAYELEIDPSGTVKRVRNWAAVSSKAAEARGKILFRLHRLGVADQARGILNNQLGALFGSERQILAHSLREVSVYHSVFANRYTPSSPITATKLLPNAFGGAPFPAAISFVLKQHDEKARRAVIEWTQTVDSEAARQIMLKAMTDAAARTGRPAPQDSDVPAMAIDDTAEMAVDVASGWLRSASYRRTSKVGANVQTDTATLADKRR
jgi:hypothetical protein